MKVITLNFCRGNNFSTVESAQVDHPWDWAVVNLGRWLTYRIINCEIVINLKFGIQKKLVNLGGSTALGVKILFNFEK